MSEHTLLGQVSHYQLSLSYFIFNRICLQTGLEAFCVKQKRFVDPLREIPAVSAESLPCLHRLQEGL